MRRLAVLLLLPLLAGCGASKGKVSGLVRYNGTPLPGGVLTFQPTNPKYNAVPVPIDENGHYEATLPVGEVQISVDNRDLQPRPPVSNQQPLDLPPEVRQKLSQAKPVAAPPADNRPAPSRPRGKYVPIPPRFYEIETSKLQFTVEPGENSHDIDLTP